MKSKIEKIKGKITMIMMNIVMCFYMAQNYVYAGIGSNKLLQEQRNCLQMLGMR